RILRTFEGTDVQILKGRWGPFISDGKKNARMPKEREPDSMTLEECLAALEAAPDKRTRGKASKKKTAKKKVAKKKKTKKKTARKKAAGKKSAPKKVAAQAGSD
ncbi:MAG TPA: topoisomerase C-terminal repeat-containing protein, partial [Xanthomonadales bacterium]|nr:topoisomerase C-terminal repeat-containing protein [Xanthomonadales bacterium]